MQAALKLQPRSVEANRALAVLDVDENRNAEAIERLRTELQTNPLDPESNLRLGELTLAQGKPSQAVTYLEAAELGRAGTPGETWHFLGEADLALHNNSAAIAALNRAVAENPSDPANHRLLAEAYRSTGRPARSGRPGGPVGRDRALIGQRSDAKA